MVAEQDLCRVTVVGPRARVDLALPVDQPFAQLLPPIAGHVGAPAEGAWVLQRLDESPFEEGSTPEQVSLRHGETLFLRPAAAHIPPPAYDDVADVVASGINGRPDRWRPAFTRAVALGIGAVTSVAAAALLLLADVPAAVAGGIAVAFLAAATALYRGFGDRTAGAVLGLAGVPHAFLGGFLALTGDARWLTGLVAVVVVAVIAVVGLGDAMPPYAGVTLAAAAGSAAVCAWLVIPGASAAGVGAVTAVVVLAATPLIPVVAFRLAGIGLPELPRNAEDLRRETLTVDSATMLARTAVADRIVTSTVLGQSLVCLVAMIPMAVSGDVLGRFTCGVFGVALLLRARVFGGRVQRLALLAAGLAGPLVMAGAIAWTGSRQVVLAGVLPGVLITGAVLTAGGLYAAREPSSPLWGRITDMLDLAVIIALLPLALGVAGVYGRIHGLAG